MGTKDITTIGFDADDTLWHHEVAFRVAGQRFVDLLSPYAESEILPDRLFAAETRNLHLYGYGVKGFTLSMIETAIEVTQGHVPASVIGDILASGREMLLHPVEPLPDVRETLETLAEQYKLILITKGDLFDQERKLAQSGLGPLFHRVEIVSEKTPSVYARIFAEHGNGSAKAMMVGNSLKSDVLPALAVGSWGVHIPHELTWAHEHAEAPQDHPRFVQLERMAELLDTVKAE